ncbi:MAG TPA: PIN domain-containing protein [Solirubrobacteraceae bacterium]|nr:PIN domain-containing protein [Solirubrobacteraceae bacterium]
MPSYLADSSIWAWARKGLRPDITNKLADRVERGEVCTCAPVVLEAMHQAKTGVDYERLYQRYFEPLDWVALTEHASDRAVQVQRDLATASHGKHLRPAVDYFVAAAAELAGDDVVLWFFDRDLRVICDHTGQAHEPEQSTGAGT